MILRRNRFDDLVRCQLDLFAGDEAELLREAAKAERTYVAADREDAEEAFSDYQLVLQAIGERLAETRDAYAATLDDDSASDYERLFARTVRKRFPESFGEL